MPLFQDEFNLKERKLRVLYITNNKGFCKFYRVKWPAQQMKEEGLADVKITSFEGFDAMSDKVVWADVIVFQFGSLSEYIIKVSEFIKENKCPQLIVMEFDDDYLNIHPTNIGAYKDFGTKEIKNKKGFEFRDGKDGFDLKRNKKRIEMLCKALIAADIITVTTTELGDQYAQFNQNVVVLPNLINPDVMPINEKEKDDRVVIAYQGGDSHYSDLRFIMPTLMEIKKKYGDHVHFKFIGANFPKLHKQVKGEFVPWIRPECFYDVFSRMKIDIGLIPLVSNVFNRGKSNIKWLEYSYYGIASVAANVLPYKKSIKPMRTGYLYSDHKQLKIFLEDLIKDPMQRKMLGGMARNAVMEKWTIKGQGKRWYETYKNALLKKIDLMNNLQ